MVAERMPEPYIDLHIERMQSEDAEAVAELDKICFPTPWSLSAYLTEAHNPSGYYIVARVVGRIVGYAGLWIIMDEAHITTIGVDPEYRGRKIGERLFTHLLDEAIRRGARRATLEVRRTNTVAQNLYEKYGFRRVAVRRGYYTNNHEDAFVMWVEDMAEDGYIRFLNDQRRMLGDIV